MTQTRRSSDEESPEAALAMSSLNSSTARSADSRIRNSSANAPRATAPTLTAPASLISRYRRLLTNRDDLTLRWAVGPGKPHWYCSRTKLTDRDLTWALEGRRYLGLYAVGKTGLSRFL